MSMTTGLDLVKSILRKVTAYQSGEQIADTDAQDCLDVVNTMLDSWSTDKQYVYGSNENILEWTVNQILYRVGNPTCTELGLAPFTGNVTGGSNLITNVTSIPSGLVAGTNTIGAGAGSTLTDRGNVIPAGTVCTAFDAAAKTVTMSQNATASFSGLDQIAYTLPGDIAIPRPLRITASYTRINELDFWFNVYYTQEQYNAILYKFQPYPWPVVAWYNNGAPYGLLNVYGAPGMAGELHLFTDTILANLTLSGTFILPQGYARAIAWCGAEEIWAEFNGASSIPPLISKKAAESLAMIKALNAQPAQVARYERALTRGDRPDGGWILHGGYNT